MRRLTAPQARWLELLAELAVTNPFSDRRVELEVALSGQTPNELRGVRSSRILELVEVLVSELDAEGHTRFGDFAGAETELLRSAFYFLAYARRTKEIDRLIEKQNGVEESLEVPFGPAALEELQVRGFTPEEARRYLGFFYQIRRAFYFIARLSGPSTAMRALRHQLWNNIFTRDIRWYEHYLSNRMEDFSTLILGETGTGKGTAAAAIGRSGFIPYDERSRRFEESFTGTFVSLNLSQFPATLIESELFGHEKGAFTGAVVDHRGVFATCSPHGSIFLDEIGEVSTPVQIKLLQVLQERVFTPLGSRQRERFRGRVIAATNRSLAELRVEGAFRDDFFYRLSTDLVEVPPLRQRIAEDPSELPRLVGLLVPRMLGADAPELVELVLTTIDRDLSPAYAWPGNVRELEQCVRRILLTGSYRGDELAGDLTSELHRALDSGSLDAAGLLGGYCSLLYGRHGSIEEVARRTKLDRRTVKKHLERFAAERL